MTDPTLTDEELAQIMIEHTTEHGSRYCFELYRRCPLPCRETISRIVGHTQTVDMGFGHDQHFGRAMVDSTDEELAEIEALYQKAKNYRQPAGSLIQAASDAIDAMPHLIAALRAERKENKRLRERNEDLQRIVDLGEKLRAVDDGY